MNRREALTILLAAAALPAPVLAASPAPVDVVKVLNFACPYCRASETVDDSIKNAVEAQGGKFVWAPIPVLKSDSGETCVEYYASRTLGNGFAQAFKASMYKGEQDMQIVLQSPNDISTWIQQDLSQYPDQISQLAKISGDPQYRQSVGKALLLTEKAGVTLLPGYIFIQNNQVVGMVDRSTAGNGSPAALRTAVLAELSKLTAASSSRKN